MKVVIPFYNHARLVCEDAKKMLRDAGFEVVTNDTGKRLAPDELKAMLRGAYGVIAGTEQYNADVLNAAKELKVIIRFGVGTDNFDLKEFKKRGIKAGVISNMNAVAEFAVTLMLASIKKLTELDRNMRTKGWERGNLREAEGKTIGIVGFGRIGRRVAQLLSGFHVRILAYDPFMPNLACDGMEFATFDRLIAEADIISLHLPQNPDTYHMFNADVFARMKKGSYLINTSRGAIVDTDALCEALRNGTLAGAGLDVFETEPLPGDSPLLEFDNVVLSPHNAALSYETNYNSSLISARSIIAVSRGEEPEYPII